MMNEGLGRLGGPPPQNNGRGKIAMTARVKGPFHNKIIILILLFFCPEWLCVITICFNSMFSKLFSGILLLSVLLTFPSVLFCSQRFTWSIFCAVVCLFKTPAASVFLCHNNRTRAAEMFNNYIIMLRFSGNRHRMKMGQRLQVFTWTPRIPNTMKKAQQMRTMFPMGLKDVIRVSTTSFRPGARLITLWNTWSRSRRMNTADYHNCA